MIADIVALRSVLMLIAAGNIVLPLYSSVICTKHWVTATHWTTNVTTAFYKMQSMDLYIIPDAPLQMTQQKEINMEMEVTHNFPTCGEGTVYVVVAGRTQQHS